MVHRSELKISTVWVTRFAEVQKQLEAAAAKDHVNPTEILSSHQHSHFH